VEEAVSRNTFSPLGGLVGEPLVNVLEVNLALDATLGKSVKAK
jgi:K+-transporting ATPase c subunit